MGNWSTTIFENNKSNSNVLFLQTSKYLLVISIWAVILEWFVSFDILYFNNTSFGVALKVVWILKLILCLASLLYIKFLFKNKYIIVLLILLILIIINILIAINNNIPIENLSASIFFYLIVIFGTLYGIILSKYFSEKTNNLVRNFKTTPLIALILILMTIFIMVQTGNIQYYGMGSQLYILIAHNLAYKNSSINLYILILCIIFTGKRALLITGIVQFFPKLIGNLRVLKNKIVFLTILCIVTTIAINFELFERFSILFEIEFSDFIDLELNKNKFYIATSGRSEEVLGFFNNISITDYGFWLGYPAGYSFDVYNLSADENISQHYLHISPLNYLKNFGIAIFGILIIIQVQTFIYAIKVSNRQRNFMLNLYIAYFVAMFFASIVTIDALFWVTFGYTYYEMKKIKNENKK